MIRSQSYCFLGIFLTIYFVFCLLPLPNTFASTTRSLCRHDQRDALLEVQKEFTIHSSDEQHVTTSTWNKSVDCCSWDGVTCDNLGKVISLELISRSTATNTSLKSTSGFFKLRHLRHLLLSDCRLQGEIPTIIGDLSLLTHLDLSFNQLVGDVPDSISNLNQLESMRLSGNHLRGNIPTSFANLTKLSELLLGGNQFTGGGIVLSNLTSLTNIDISSNHFKSSILPYLSGLHKLETFRALDNSFVGPFPSSLLMIPSLVLIDLSQNQFEGPIDNHFTGSIPQCLKRFMFEELNLKNNNLSGFLPDLFIDGCSLLSLDVSGNNLVGKLPKSLINCEYMEFLNVKGNKIEDTFPFWLRSLQTLQVLGLRSNAFYGPIYNPSTYLGFPSLRIIDISNNNFDGSLPQDYFANWTAMSTVFQNSFE